MFSLMVSCRLNLPIGKSINHFLFLFVHYFYSFTLQKIFLFWPYRPPGPPLATRLKNNLITKRIGQSQSSVINHIVPPPNINISGRRFRGNWQRGRRRLRQPLTRDPYLTGNSNVNYHNRRYLQEGYNQNGIQGAFDDEFQNTFKNSQPRPPRVPQVPPNIFSQGHPGNSDSTGMMPYNPTLPEHTIYVHPPTTTKPPIRRPPPQHPGVRVPGVEVPPHSGSIQDIIEAVDPNRRVTNDRHPTSFPGYRPPIGWNNKNSQNLHSQYNPETNTYEYQHTKPDPGYSPVSYYEAPVKVPNLTPPDKYKQPVYPTHTPNYYHPTVIPPVQQHTERPYQAPYNPPATYPPYDISVNQYRPVPASPPPSISDKVDKVTYQQQPSPPASHFFNEVNKMEPIVLHEQQPNYHSPYTTPQPSRYDYGHYTTAKPIYTSPPPPSNFINMNAVNSYTSLGANQNTFTRRPIVSSSFGLGKPTGMYITITKQTNKQTALFY